METERCGGQFALVVLSTRNRSTVACPGALTVGGRLVMVVVERRAPRRHRIVRRARVVEWKEPSVVLYYRQQYVTLSLMD